MTNKRRGRRRGMIKWTSDQETLFFESVGLGTSIKDVAYGAGVSFDTVLRRRTADVAFEARFQTVRAQLRATCLRTVHAAAAKGDWRAATWVLERSDPQHFSTRVQAEQPNAAASVAEARDREKDAETADFIRSTPEAFKANS